MADEKDKPTEIVINGEVKKPQGKPKPLEEEVT
jgi:hypothetical protein